jgi:hypothetical protein
MTGDFALLTAEVRVTVSDPHGPRAPVQGPPFPAAVPIVAADILPGPGSPGPDRVMGLGLDCTGHPAAARLLATSGADRALCVAIEMRTHATGNGYVVLGIDLGERPAPVPGHTAALELVFDPVLHAGILDEVRRIGWLMLVDVAATPPGLSAWTLGLDTRLLAEMTESALAHPRVVTVRFGADPASGRAGEQPSDPG